MSKIIHPTAVINPKAELDKDVIIGPYCFIGEGVRINRGTELKSHIIIEGETSIGENCTIFPFTSIGLPPQDLKYNGEKTGVVIGDGNTIRESVTIHRASVGGDGLTSIGNNNFLMAYVHIAHDCKIGNSIIMANAVTLGGHVEVGNYVMIGGLVAVHQFVRIGEYSMIGGFSGVNKDVPPYTISSTGAFSKVYGINSIGLKRNEFDNETIQSLKKAFNTLFKGDLTMQKAIKTVRDEFPDSNEVVKLTDFISKPKKK